MKHYAMLCCMMATILLSACSDYDNVLTNQPDDPIVGGASYRYPETYIENDDGSLVSILDRVIVIPEDTDEITIPVISEGIVSFNVRHNDNRAFTGELIDPLNYTFDESSITMVVTGCDDLLYNVVDGAPLYRQRLNIQFHPDKADGSPESMKATVEVNHLQKQIFCGGGTEFIVVKQ